MLDGGCVNVFMSFHAQVGTPQHSLPPPALAHFMAALILSFLGELPCFFEKCRGNQFKEV